MNQSCNGFKVDDITGLSALLPENVGFSIGALCHGLEPVYEKESELIVNAVKKRKVEFLNGRHHARKALAAIGKPCAGIGRLPSRAPNWPEGYVGSISHSKYFAGAIAARSSAFLSLGFDIEDKNRISKSLMQYILSKRETWANTKSKALIVFSIKEAFFKAYHPRAGEFLDKDDIVVIESDAHPKNYTVELVSNDKPTLLGRRRFSALFAEGDEWIASVVVIDQSKSRETQA